MFLGSPTNFDVLCPKDTKERFPADSARFWTLIRPAFSASSRCSGWQHTLPQTAPFLRLKRTPFFVGSSIISSSAILSDSFRSTRQQPALLPCNFSARPFELNTCNFIKAFLDRGVRFGAWLGWQLTYGDVPSPGFLKFLFSWVNEPIDLSAPAGPQILHRFVKKDQFDVVEMLVQRGVSIDAMDGEVTPLCQAVLDGNAGRVKFLLRLGADPNVVCTRDVLGAYTALGIATTLGNTKLAGLLFQHGANPATEEGLDLFSWSSLNCRPVYQRLRKHASDWGIALGDVAGSAREGIAALRAYIDAAGPPHVEMHHLDHALVESIKRGHADAVASLLHYGVDPNSRIRFSCGSPLYVAVTAHVSKTATSQATAMQIFQLLIQFHANANEPGLLSQAIKSGNSWLLPALLDAGVDLTGQGAQALRQAAKRGDVTAAEWLLQHGVDINAHHKRRTPLQTAAERGYPEMVEFLLSRGADINAPAHRDGGRTALQAALNCSFECLSSAQILLREGADILAPPALVEGLTALEAMCDHMDSWTCPRDLKDHFAILHRLLDAGAPLNLPDGRPSLALHLAVAMFDLDPDGWSGVIARMLEPDRGAILSYPRFDYEGIVGLRQPSRTVTQSMVAEGAPVGMLRMLVDRGANVNEPAARRRGRTALQEAALREPPDMELVEYLLDKGADVNADPAADRGLTALQGAAIRGHIMVAKILLVKGADVNAAPALIEGRYAIEGAAEHGRLDMVQLLLNAGARGHVKDGTGFAYAIQLAEQEGYSAIADLLREAAL